MLHRVGKAGGQSRLARGDELSNPSATRTRARVRGLMCQVFSPISYSIWDGPGRKARRVGPTRSNHCMGTWKSAEKHLHIFITLAEHQPLGWRMPLL